MDSQDNVRFQLKGMPTSPLVENRATSPPPVTPKKKKSHWQAVLCALIILAAYMCGDYFGHDRGYTQGKTDTYDTAYAKGKDAGYTTGYDDGYDNGYSDGEKYGRAAEISKNLRNRLKTNSSINVK